jgi:hypothetical protein
MEELIKLRELRSKEKEKASSLIKFTKAIDPESVWIKANKRAELAFSDIIERLDLILNNSVVKPSERRSPTDENFSGCKPPDERQNPQEDLICPSCKKEKGALENCYLDSKCCVCTLKDKLKNFKACK